MLLVSKYYPTRDSDPLVSLSIFPDSIDCFSRKASLSTKGTVKLVVESKLLIRIICRFSQCLVGFLGFIPGSLTFVHFGSPLIVIASLVISIHSVVFNTAAVVISSAPIVFFTIVDNFFLFFNQMPCWSSVRTIPFPVARATSAKTSIRSNFFVLLSCECDDLFVEFQLEFRSFSAKCDDLILLTKLFLPHSVFRHVVYVLMISPPMYEAFHFLGFLRRYLF
jgi:hypothetical protein